LEDEEPQDNGKTNAPIFHKHNKIQIGAHTGKKLEQVALEDVGEETQWLKVHPEE
jgi:hypothetical protein